MTRFDLLILLVDSEVMFHCRSSSKVSRRTVCLDPVYVGK